jgi:hypothetical protein
MNSQSQAMQVLTSTNTVNWYTPPQYIEMARSVMGYIGLDPATCNVAQQWIKADNYHTLERIFDSGLNDDWHTNVWLNPPFDDTSLWCNKLYLEIQKGNIDQAIILVNSNHGYKWYETLWRMFPVCCARERIEFLTDIDPLSERGKTIRIGNQTLMTVGQAKRGQTFAYYGANVELFYETFKTIGRVIIPKKG